ncbi:hypothetical protein PF008_g29724 [Phytophthora fragariae]|uniref:Uncharacterized protein n=1 Tax=Phytophthora fragariae TaxID=53985 RepID=A0A6G0Q7Q0_9STRA|nr:hypothetical protein PF008_g29724 [Phytophthora fragariae]
MRGVLALLVNVLFVTALTIAFFLHTRRLRELTARLLGTVPTGNDHRPDTATRDAEKGFQLRARKWNSWARKLDVEGDVEGNMFWFRMKEGSGIMAPARVGKVMRFVKPNASSRTPEQVNGFFAA